MILPSGVLACNVPIAVKDMLASADDVDPDETLPQEYGVARTIANKAGYQLEVRTDQESTAEHTTSVPPPLPTQAAVFKFFPT